MLSPDYLSSCADDIVGLYSEFETSIIEDMARRIVRMEDFISQATLDQMDRLQQAGMLYDDIIAQIAKLTNLSDKELRALFEDAGATAIGFDDGVYKSAGLDPLPFGQSEGLLELLLAGMRKTGGSLSNLTMTTATTGQTAFINALDLAYMQVSSGGMSYTQAIRNALKQLSQQGVTAVRYDKNGRASYHKIDVATRRAVITGVNQTAAELQLMRMEEMLWDLVETTAHFGARPDHVDWQGQVFSRSGQSRQYPDFISITGYGTGAGLCGWNCRHNFFPYYAGASLPSYSRAELAAMRDATVKFGGEEVPLYLATQMQREMERAVRALKRELAALNAGVLSSRDEALAKYLKDEFIAVSQDLKQHERDLNAFARATGIARQREREQVVGFGRSVAQKAVWEDKKARGVPQSIH